MSDKKSERDVRPKNRRNYLLSPSINSSELRLLNFNKNPAMTDQDSEQSNRIRLVGRFPNKYIDDDLFDEEVPLSLMYNDGKYPNNAEVLIRCLIENKEQEDGKLDLSPI
ncbi:hypothetical protein PTKIN_Ptkin09bG0275100 [Pterospermum kingtungense]